MPEQLYMEVRLKRRYYWPLKLWIRTLTLLVRLRIISPHRAVTGFYWLYEKLRSRMLIIGAK